MRHWIRRLSFTLVTCILCGCEKKVAPPGRSEAWTNTAPNGIVIITTPDRIELIMGADQGLSFRWNPTNQEVSGLVLETPSRMGVPGQWITDSNFDGVPEMRRLKGIGRELFYEGRWYPFTPVGDAVSIDVDGTSLRLRFDGSRWVEM